MLKTIAGCNYIEHSFALGWNSFHSVKKIMKCNRWKLSMNHLYTCLLCCQAKVYTTLHYENTSIPNRKVSICVERTYTFMSRKQIICGTEYSPYKFQNICLTTYVHSNDNTFNGQHEINVSKKICPRPVYGNGNFYFGFCIVGWGTILQAERSRVRFSMRLLDFSNGLIIPAAL
jgi:hypothetical protein